MKTLLYLSNVFLLTGHVNAGLRQVPLVAKGQVIEARPARTNTSCPASANNPLHLLEDIISNTNSTCGIIVDPDYSIKSSLNHASNSQQCISVAGSSSSYCIYAFPEFAQGRGLVIISSPSVAPIVPDAAESFLNPAEAGDYGRFYQKPIPGRGIGLISNDTFRKGDLILTATPLLIVQEQAMSDLGEEDRHSIQQLSISTLPSRSKEMFHNLAGHFGGNHIEDVILTNAFSTTFGESNEGFGIVVPEAARLNHDCRPNARFAFDTRALSHKVHATRDIERGEELTFSYLDEKQPYSARQEKLESHWGFKCNCKLCSASENHRNISDTRLRRISVLRGSLFSFTAENYATITPEMVLELVSLYEAEDLSGAVAEAYMVTSLWYCVWGDVLATKKWATLAIENWLVWEASGEKNLQQMKSLMRQPQDHWCWRAKEKSATT